jgi:hypothetical protein
MSAIFTKKVISLFILNLCVVLENITNVSATQEIMAIRTEVLLFSVATAIVCGLITLYILKRK